MTIEPKIEQRVERPYVAIPIRVTRKEWGRANALFGEVFEWLDRNGLDPAGPPFVRFRVIGDMDREYDIDVGVPVAKPVSGDGRVIAGSMPAGSYATVVHTGHPDQLFEVDAVLQDWAVNGKLTWANRTEGQEEVWGGRFESFLTDPAEQPDPDQWSMELAYLLEGGTINAEAEDAND